MTDHTLLNLVHSFSVSTDDGPHSTLGGRGSRCSVQSGGGGDSIGGGSSPAGVCRNGTGASAGSNRRDASARSNRRDASAGSNRKDASAGSNHRDASAGPNRRDASAVATCQENSRPFKPGRLRTTPPSSAYVSSHTQVFGFDSRLHRCVLCFDRYVLCCVSTTACVYTMVRGGGWG